MKKHGILLLQWIVVLSATVTGGAALAADEMLPATQHAGAVSYVSGGIGLDQSKALQRAMHNYPLVLTFVRARKNDREYLANVAVTIKDGQGNTVLDAASDGPFMLVSLPNGRYTVSASFQGKSQQHAVAVSRSQHVRQTFSWPR
ncbi:MAG TPA: carboxypeptidase-like regulatory domain-containing protein [Bordetella sp.]